MLMQIHGSALCCSLLTQQAGEQMLTLPMAARVWLDRLRPGGDEASAGSRWDWRSCWCRKLCKRTSLQLFCDGNKSQPTDYHFLPPPPSDRPCPIFFCFSKWLLDTRTVFHQRCRGDQFSLQAFALTQFSRAHSNKLHCLPPLSLRAHKGRRSLALQFITVHS